MAKELMPEDDDIVHHTNSMVSEMLRLLKGDSFNREKGMIQEFEDFKDRLIALERGYKKIFNMLVGIGIGIGIASVIFGGMTLKALLNFIK